MDDDKLLTSVHALSGAVAGYLSNFTGQPTHALGVAIAVLLVTGNAAKIFVSEDEERGLKWWISNGAVPFILIWAVFSVFFYNL